jgi:acetyl esterase
MMDYQSIIDAETWAFIRETDGWYPPETATFPIEKQREIYDAMCRAFHRGYPDGLHVEDRSMGGVPCRLYTPKTPRGTVIYFHGGGFVVGGLHSHDDICAEIADGCGLRVVSVDYRLAPEHRHPAAFDDALAATRAVAAGFPGALVLAGDSAGGNLAAATAHALRGDIAPVGMVLIYPGLGGDMTRGSYIAHAHAPMLTLADVQFYKDIRAPQGIALAPDPTHAPLSDSDFTRLPPTAIFVAECDPLADDGPAYAARLAAAGVNATCTIEAGLVHGYLRARRTVPRAADSFARILRAVSGFVT